MYRILGAHLNLDVGAGRRAVDSKTSSLDMIIFTGCPVFCDISAASGSRYIGIFPPNPPPISIGTTVILDTGRSNAPAKASLAANAALGAGPHGQVAVGVPKSSRVLWLNVALVDGGGAEFPLYNDVGFLEPLVYVALLVPQVGSNVAGFIGAFPNSVVVTSSCSNCSGIFIASRTSTYAGRTSYSTSIKSTATGSNVGVNRRHGRDRMAFVKDFLVGQQVFAGDRAPRPGESILATGMSAPVMTDLTPG